jgi:hypothetical protein
VHDCQWIQQLPSLGLLTAAFRPEESIRPWRASQRHRASFIEDAGRSWQRIEKALEQMHVKLPEVVSDITGGRDRHGDYLHHRAGKARPAGVRQAP